MKPIKPLTLIPTCNCCDRIVECESVLDPEMGYCAECLAEAHKATQEAGQ